MERIEKARDALTEAQEYLAMVLRYEGDPGVAVTQSLAKKIDAALSALEAEGGTASPEAPEDVAGLVERLQGAVPSTYEQEGDGYYDTPLTFAVREAASALTRIAAERDEALALAVRLNGGQEMQSIMRAHNNTLAEASTLRARIAELEGKEALRDPYRVLGDQRVGVTISSDAARRYVEEGK